MTLDLAVDPLCMTTKAPAKKRGGGHKLDFSKINIFCTPKDTMKEKNIQSIEWEKTYLIHIFVRSQISRMYY